MEKRRIVVLGTGFAALELVFQVVLALAGMVEITVISKTDRFFFMPNWIFTPFGMTWEKLRVPLRKVFARRGVRFIQGEVIEIDAKRSFVKVISQQEGIEEPQPMEVVYDKLIIGTGAQPDPGSIPGLEEHGLIVGSKMAADTLRVVLQGLKNGSSNKRQRILLVNPGGHFCAGPLYEVLFMLDHWLKVNGLQEQVEVMLYTAEDKFIATFGPGVHRLVKEMLRKRRIPAERGMRLVRVEQGEAIFENGSTGHGVEFDLLVALSPQVGTHFGLPHTEKGFIRVNRETMQVLGNPSIYAIGDANDFPLNQGFLAMLQANTAMRHLIMKLQGKQFKPFEALTMCIMYMGSTATFAQCPLKLAGDAITIDGARLEKYLIGTSRHWLACKHLLGMAIMTSFRLGYPFHGGLMWKLFFGPCLAITTKFLAHRAQS